MTLLELFALIRKHLAVVIIVPIAFAAITAAVCFLVLPDTYTGSVSMYVLNKSQSDEGSLTNTDLTASQMITNDVVTLAKSSRVQNDAAQAVGLDSLSGYSVSVESSTTTRIITITVTGREPYNVAVIANQLASTVDGIAREVMGVQSVNVIDAAIQPESPSGPPRLMYTAVAFLAGLFVAIAAVVIADMANTRVRSAEEASELVGLSVIGRIPVIKA